MGRTRCPFFRPARGAAFMLMAWSFVANAQTAYMAAPALDLDRVKADDERRAEAGDLALYGRSLPIMAESGNDGEWTLEDGERVWRLGITSTGALALELWLDQLDVPPGASIRLSTPRGEQGPAQPLEPGTSTTSTAMVLGDSCLLEYREPFGAGWQGRLRVSHVVHAYRDVERGADEGNCHVNVACTPEGDGWADAARATVRISVVVPQGSGWCTGTLMNNTRQDCEPYILTAFHCGRQSTTANFNQYKFYFNFQYANCNGGAYSTAQSLTGAQLKAYSDDYAPQYQGVGGSDFMLLRTNSAIPSAFQPYYAGWDATSIASVADDGVCIHHPTGAPKRISSYTQTLITGHPMGSSGLMSHYKVVWAQTQHGWGITEVGSSGAGLFKQKAGLGPVLIGTCTGNTSGMSCSNHNGYAYFGKMSYHWTQNPNAANIKLKPWLDPDNTGILALAGTAAPCGTTASIQEGPLLPNLRLMPNPASRNVVLESTDQGAATYKLYNLAGQPVCSGSYTGGRATIDLSALPAGSYLIRSLTLDGRVATAPLMITN